MKATRILLIMVLLGLTSLFGNIAQYYTFMPSTGTYTAITGTQVPTAVGDDAVSVPIDIGFPFVYGTATYSQVRISANGVVSLGVFPNLTETNELTGTNYPVLAPLWDDLYLQGSCQVLLTGATPNRIFTIQFTNNHWYYFSDCSVNFQVKIYETGKVEFVYGAIQLTPSWPSASIGINMSPGGAGNYWSVTPGIPATASSTTENITVATWPGNGTIYAFIPFVDTSNDMAALTLTGNANPTQGQVATYTVGISNMGTGNQAAGAYTVKLMNGNTELASVPGPAIAAGVTSSVQISWTPAVSGAIQMTGKAVLAGDGNSTNDLTAPMNVYVMPTGTVTIGAGDQVNGIPLDFYWMNSMSETLYFANEINTTGAITGIAYYNNFVSNLENKPVNIWMGNSTLADLTAGWVPSNQLTQVFAGNLSFPVGVNTIMIALPTPFNYTGGNLIMLVERPMDTEYFNTNDNFLCQTLGTNRTRLAASDEIDLDPANPPAGGNAIGQFPKISLSFTPGGNGILNGTVTFNTATLEGVTVTINNTTLVETTDAAGFYSFPFVPSGNYTVTFSKTGYLDLTIPAVITSGQTTTLNAIIQPSQTLSVFGTVTGSDAPATGLANATINLTGFVNYSGVTNGMGQFQIAGILANHTYAYVIAKAGYQSATGNVTVTNANYNMNTVILDELIIPVSDVQAAENAPHTAVMINWLAPGATLNIQGQASAAIADRTLLGYKLWRLMTGQETNETAWVLVSPNTFSVTNYADTGWAQLPNGDYRWAVKAFYSNDLLSTPILSNILTRINPIGTIAGVVTTAGNSPLSGVTITAGNFAATTNAIGAYNIQVYTGTYSVSAHKTGYAPQTQNNIVVTTGQTTIVNFNNMTVANEDDITPVIATALQVCYPNPFLLSTSIRYTVKDTAPVKVEIYNTKGQKVKSLVNDLKAAGNYCTVWDGTDDNGCQINSGVYFCKLTAGKHTDSQKVVLLR